MREFRGGGGEERGYVIYGKGRSDKKEGEECNEGERE